jgi:hypothetical protein
MPDSRVLKASPMAAQKAHHQIDEHRHPGGRDVDKNDPVAFALLEIGGCNQHAEPEAG